MMTTSDISIASILIAIMTMDQWMEHEQRRNKSEWNNKTTIIIIIIIIIIITIIIATNNQTFDNANRINSNSH